jgi:processing peptidase subunit alpha
MYQAATFNSAVPSTIGILAETIRDPMITPEEVEQQLMTADYEINEIWTKPDLILSELVHMAAYKDNTLGNPLLCPKERLEFIDRDVIQKYQNEFYKPERMVVAFAGVDHPTAVQLTEQYFGDMKKGQGPVLSQLGDSSTISESSQPSNPDLTSSIASQASQSQPKESGLITKIPFFKNFSTSATSSANVVPTPVAPTFQPLNFAAPSHYTGGFLSLPAIPPPLNPALPRLSYIHLAFEALPISHPDIYALATLQTLLGGGGSFSAGGPGKGMYSRLYTNVLNQFGWVESCVAFNHSYSDSGLFGISASCSPQHTRSMLDVLCRELEALSDETGWNRLQEGEVMRAKNQLRSNLLMNLESRMIELEDLGRQVQIHGRKVGVKEMCEKIEQLTVKDLRRVAREVVRGMVVNPGNGSGAPTVVLQEGDEENRKRVDFGWEEIQEKIAKWKLGRR